MGARIKSNKRIIYFDGVCGLCNSIVDILLKIDIEEKFLYSPLQSKYAEKNFLEKHPQYKNVHSIVLKGDKRYMIKSDAVIAIIKELKWYWKVFLFIQFLPKKLRDRAYDYIAKKRYKWFGKREKCRVPSGKNKSRFLITP